MRFTAQDVMAAKRCFQEMADDPAIWATHGRPSDAKEGLIILRIADAIAFARNNANMLNSLSARIEAA